MAVVIMHVQVVTSMKTMEHMYTVNAQSVDSFNVI